MDHTLHLRSRIRVIPTHLPPDVSDLHLERRWCVKENERLRRTGVY